MRYKKQFIALKDFKINPPFQSFVEKLNQRQTGPNRQENTGGQGSCALQSFELYYQMLHNQNGFKSVKYHFIEKEGFLDENIKEKRTHIAFHMQNYIPYESLFFMMYRHYFLKARFLKTSNLRAFLEKEEFFKVPIICNIRCKVDAGHVNILYRDEKGLFVINTNENSKNKIKLIEAHNGDVFALENIAYNWTGEFENVKEFRLFIPYEKIKIEEPKVEEFEEEIEEEEIEEELQEEFEEEFEDELEIQSENESMSDENVAKDLKKMKLKQKQDMQRKIKKILIIVTVLAVFALIIKGFL